MMQWGGKSYIYNGKSIEGRGVQNKTKICRLHMRKPSRGRANGQIFAQQSGRARPRPPAGQKEEEEGGRGRRGWLQFATSMQVPSCVTQHVWNTIFLGGNHWHNRDTCHFSPSTKILEIFQTQNQDLQNGLTYPVESASAAMAIVNAVMLYIIRSCVIHLSSN